MKDKVISINRIVPSKSEIDSFVTVSKIEINCNYIVHKLKEGCHDFISEEIPFNENETIEKTLDLFRRKGWKIERRFESNDPTPSVKAVKGGQFFFERMTLGRRKIIYSFS